LSDVFEVEEWTWLADTIASEITLKGSEQWLKTIWYLINATVFA
jgi:hypothetical protein